jgi:hypothetical protein
VEQEDNDEGPQQEVNDVAAAITAEKVDDTHLSGKEDGSPSRQHRPHSKPRGRAPKSHSPLDQGSTVQSEENRESDAWAKHHKRIDIGGRHEAHRLYGK